MMINHLRDYFLTCPLLHDGFAMNVDFLSTNGVEYSIDTMPYNPVVETYIDGSSIRKCNFIFASREHYNQDSTQNLENIQFYENLIEWIENNNVLNILPKLDLGQTALKLSVNTAGYILDENLKTARYQIQCSLEYLQERNS